MQEVYSQLKGLKGDLEKVKQVNRQLKAQDSDEDNNDSSSGQDDSDYDSEQNDSSANDDEQEEPFTPTPAKGLSKLEQRYQFLAKSSHQLLSKDAANVSAANTTLINQINE